MSTLRIALIGYGRMGKLIEQIAIERGHTICHIIDRAEQLTLFREQAQNCDVAIDFSQAEALEANLDTCFSMNVPVVVGTTGWYEKFDLIRQKVEAGNHGMFFAPNFSIGMNIVFALNRRLASLANKRGFDISLHEVHHIHKRDAPSGTAIRLATDIIAHNDAYQSWHIGTQKTDSVLPVEVERTGEVNGIHQISASSPDEIILLRHEALNRRGFAVGAVLAAEFIVGKRGLFSMVDLLGDSF